MRRFIFIALLALICSATHAQTPDKPVAGQCGAMGQTYIAQRGGWAGISNCAALGWDSTYWVGMHHENRFVIAELGLSAVAGRIPVKPGAFGVSVSHTGYNQFSITRADISYGMKLSPKLVAGVSFGLHHAQLSGVYKNRNAFTVSAGLQYQPTPKVIIGTFLFNPARASIDEQQSMPALLGVGLTYMPAREVTLALQVDADTERRTAIRGGIEYKPIEAFALRLGYSSANLEGASAGFAIYYKGFAVDVAASHHQILGFTPQMSVGYGF